MKGMRKMNRKKLIYFVLLLLGVGLVCVGAFAINGQEHKELSGVCIGIGAGLFGMAAGELIQQRIIEKNPEAKRRMDIDANDERHRRINDMARAKAFGVTQVLYAVLALVFVLIGERLLTILLVIGAYVVGWGVYLGCLGKYQKEM